MISEHLSDPILYEQQTDKKPENFELHQEPPSGPEIIRNKPLEVWFAADYLHGHKAFFRLFKQDIPELVCEAMSIPNAFAALETKITTNQRLPDLIFLGSSYSDRSKESREIANFMANVEQLGTNKPKIVDVNKDYLKTTGDFLRVLNSVREEKRQEEPFEYNKLIGKN
jgi:hypothetical protein